MKVKTLDESTLHDIGHAFGYYDYGAEHGLIDAFPRRDAAAAFVDGYVRMALQSGMLYTTSENHEGFIAYRRPGENRSCGRFFLWPKRCLAVWFFEAQRAPSLFPHHVPGRPGPE